MNNLTDKERERLAEWAGGKEQLFCGRICWIFFDDLFVILEVLNDK